LNPTLQTDAIFPWFIAQQLPAGVSGLVIAGLFAAAMSTLDSSLNSVATVITTDFFKRFLPRVSDRYWLRLARWLTLLLGIIGTGAALFMATIDVTSLWDQWMKLLGLFGGGLAGLFVLGIFTGRAHGHGALVGAITSAMVLYFFQEYTRAHVFLYGAVGVISCVTVGYVASIVIPGETRSLEGLTILTLARRTKNAQAITQ
jgi:Na+/proline symporter